MVEGKSGQFAERQVDEPAGPTTCALSGSGQRRREVLVDRAQELLGGQPGLVRAD